jgi:hypothetical protein
VIFQLHKVSIGNSHGANCGVEVICSSRRYFVVLIILYWQCEKMEKTEDKKLMFERQLV